MMAKLFLFAFLVCVNEATTKFFRVFLKPYNVYILLVCGFSYWSRFLSSYYFLLKIQFNSIQNSYIELETVLSSEDEQETVPYEYPWGEDKEIGKEAWKQIIIIVLI